MNKKWPEITLDTHIEELKAIHNRIWDECIEEHGAMVKPDTPYKYDCVACEVAYLRSVKTHNGSSMCLLCPMFEYAKKCLTIGSLYDKWHHYKTQELAQQIRDYKWREETDD